MCVLATLRSVADALRADAALGTADIALGLDLCGEITALLAARTPPSRTDAAPREPKRATASAPPLLGRRAQRARGTAAVCRAA